MQKNITQLGLLLIALFLSERVCRCGFHWKLWPSRTEKNLGILGDPIPCVLLLLKWLCLVLAEMTLNHTACASWLDGIELQGMGIYFL